MIFFPKLLMILFPAAAGLALFSSVAFGDSVLTQDHKIHQGHIVYEDDSQYVLKDAGGSRTYSAKEVLGVYYTERPYETDEQMFRLYRERASQISHEDVWERFDLAQFCLDAGLYRQAALEFRALVPVLTQDSRKLEQWIRKSEEADFQANWNKAIWYSEVGHQEEKAVGILESLKTEYPEYAARSQLNAVLSKVQKRLSQEIFRENIKSQFVPAVRANFQVYAKTSSEAEEIAALAEKIRAEVAAKLFFEKNLSWENSCEIFVFEKESDYAQASGLENWSIASSLVSFDQDNHLLPFNVRRCIVMNMEGRKYLPEVILTHEIAHLLIRDRVGITLHLPPWISEGFAQFFHISHAHPKQTPSLSFETLVQLEKYPPFERVFYEESAGLTRFLIDRGGVQKFLALAYLTGIGKPLKESLREIYPKDIEEIESMIYQLQRENTEEPLSDSPNS